MQILSFGDFAGERCLRFREGGHDATDGPRILNSTFQTRRTLQPCCFSDLAAAFHVAHLSPSDLWIPEVQVTFRRAIATVLMTKATIHKKCHLESWPSKVWFALHTPVLPITMNPFTLSICPIRSSVLRFPREGMEDIIFERTSLGTLSIAASQPRQIIDVLMLVIRSCRRMQLRKCSKRAPSATERSSAPEALGAPRELGPLAGDVGVALCQICIKTP